MAEQDNCKTSKRFAICNGSDRHHIVRGVCLHPFGDGHTQVRAEGGEVVAVIYASGAFVAAIDENPPKERC